MWTDPVNIYITQRHMTMEIGTEGRAIPKCDFRCSVRLKNFTFCIKIDGNEK
jgi:hypothetical protein